MKQSKGIVWPKHRFVLYILLRDSALATHRIDRKYNFDKTRGPGLLKVRAEVLNFLLFLVLLVTIS